ncbi:hypothetical protein BU15DRAFT_64726 [Melanogaster broomeanus]|nr:hypothetical protein BU15DRAFT_64726 [Melanogaster broomeanus]
MTNANGERVPLKGHTNCPARPMCNTLSRRGTTRHRSQSPSASAAHPAKRQKTNTLMSAFPAYGMIPPEGFGGPLPQAPGPTAGLSQAETAAQPNPASVSSSDPHQSNIMMFGPRLCVPQLEEFSSHDGLHLDLDFNFTDFTDSFSSFPDHGFGSPGLSDHNSDALQDVSLVPSPPQSMDENEMFMQLVRSVAGVDNGLGAQDVDLVQDVEGAAQCGASQLEPSPVDNALSAVDASIVDVTDNDDVEWESEEELLDEKYVMNDNLRSKRHSERLKRIMASIKQLEAATKPYILIYVARPESVLARNGKAKCYASPAMLGVLGKKSTFIEHLHQKVKKYTQQQVMSEKDIVALNIQVSRAHDAKRSVEQQLEGERQENDNLRAQLSQLLTMQGSQVC